MFNFGTAMPCFPSTPLDLSTGYIILMLPPNVVLPEAVMFSGSVSPSVRATVHYKNTIVPIFKSTRRIFTKHPPLMAFGTRANASSFAVKSSNLKVIQASNMLENAISHLVNAATAINWQSYALHLRVLLVNTFCTLT